MEAPQVKILQGTLQGKIEKTLSGRQYYSFEGIPYAKPPVGLLRFKEPQEPDTWHGVRDATKPGNKCAQINPFAPEFIGSEDCLYLNVYTPQLPTKDLQKLPVIFYVHGGRLILGYGDYHRPEFFMERDVILVTINYRLNVLGFLALDLPEAPGNVGMKDAVLALKWVNKNIDFFHGNKNNVSVMGESAGSGVVTCLLVTKLAEGLFHKAIFESGTSLSDLFMEGDHINKAQEFVSYLGQDLKHPREIYEYLMTLPVEQLMDGVVMCELNKEEINAFFLPILDNNIHGIEPFLIDYPYKLYSENKFNKVPILAGVHSHEGALFLPVIDGAPSLREDLEFYIPKYLFIPRDSDIAKRMAREIKNYYFKDKPIGLQTIEQYVHMLSDAYFLRDLYMFFDILSKYYNDIYIYRFSYTGNMNTSVMKKLQLTGASHGDIIAYQFYRQNKANNMTEEDKKIVDFLSEVWVNFAKNGKPTWTGQNMGWLPYQFDEKFMLNIDSEFTQAIYPERQRIEFWKKIMKPRSKM